MYLFLDSSAFAKLLIVENGSEKVHAYVRGAGGVSVSSLLWLETRSALRRRERFGDLTRAEVEDRLQRLDSLFGRIDAVDVDRDVLKTASLIIDRQGLRSLDAIQLASAMHTRRALDDLLVLCADVQLAAAFRVEGFEVIDPTEPHQ